MQIVRSKKDQLKFWGIEKASECLGQWHGGLKFKGPRQLLSPTFYSHSCHSPEQNLKGAIHTGKRSGFAPASQINRPLGTKQNPAAQWDIVCQAAWLIHFFPYVWEWHVVVSGRTEKLSHAHRIHQRIERIYLLARACEHLQSGPYLQLQSMVGHRQNCFKLWRKRNNME